MAYKVSSEVVSLFKSCYRQIAKIQVLGIEGLEEIKESDILQGGLTIDRYCFSSNALEIGTAIASEATLELKNADGRFDGYTFDGAKLIIRVGIKKWNAKVWENATMHYVPLGVFTIDEKTKNKSNITLNALDNMVKFDREYDTTLAFPATLGEIVEDACSRCGVLLKTTSFYNSDYVVNTRPTDDGLTYRQVIQWAAQLSCTNAFIDWDGQLRLTWFEDSGHIIPAADRYDSDMEEHSVLITGVKVTAADESEYTAGEKGSVLCIEGNSLAQSDAETIAKIIYAKVGNFTYLPYSSVCRPMPYLYPMDMITFVDRRGNEHKTIVSAVTYTMNGTTDVVGEGDGSTKGGYASTGSTTTHEKVIIEKAKKAAEKTSTGQFNVALALNETIGSAFGLYRTEITENKVSTWYYHDKATLNDSTIIYVFNSGGFAWTEDWNDGNPVWQYGFTKDGNALYKILSAYKIQAEFIDANAITSEKIAAGVITADKIKAGAIGGFTIDETHIGIGKTSYNDTENDGVYISTSGIGLGKGKFYVTDKGFFHAEEGEFVGNIKGGTININDNFIVDENGGVQLNGGITWGTGSSPTQVVYARSPIEKPDDNTAWSSFPSTSGNSWHKTYSSYLDYYASYTYDGGKTWTDPIKIKGTDGTNGSDGANGADGSDGDTKEIVYLYYRKTSSSAPSKPSYDGSSLPTGWSLTPTGVTSYYLYEFVSQCTVTNGTYGTWSTPVIWAKYGVNGSDGSDATVTDQNVFNALTSNGTMYGCFTALNGKLYINAAYINAGTLSSDYTFTGKLVAENADITGTVYATAGELENLTITGKLYFGGDTQYYINANCNDGSYYIYLPDFRVNDASGAVFSGKLSGATGTFSGALSAATGSFSGSITSTSAVITGGRIEIGEVITVKEDGTVKIKSSAGNGNGILNIDNYWIELQSGASNLEMTSTHLRIKDNSYVGSQGRNILNWVELWGGKVSMYRDGVYFTIYIDGSPKAVCPHNLYITGNWTGSSSGSISSDANKKNTIENMEEAYDVLFDNLKPRTFKYNNGTSDRLHTGYIAQEVKSAMDLAGIDAKNFAALCIDRPNTEYEEWSLRYEEFVSINTWQIQKLKQRVAELEALIKS